MAHTIDEDTKKIVKAIVHGDQKRQSRRRAGKHTDFDRKAAEAIKAAKKELPLEGTDPEVRRHIIDKLYTSLLYNTPWELLGETYCCRRLFYEYRKEFCYLIAVHMEIIEPEGGSRQQAGRVGHMAAAAFGFPYCRRAGTAQLARAALVVAFVVFVVVRPC